MLCNRWITNDPQNKYCLLLEVIDMPNFNRYMCYGCWNIVHLKTTAKMLDIESGWQFQGSLLPATRRKNSANDSPNLPAARPMCPPLRRLSRENQNPKVPHDQRHHIDRKRAVYVPSPAARPPTLAWPCHATNCAPTTSARRIRKWKSGNSHHPRLRAYGTRARCRVARAQPRTGRASRYASAQTGRRAVRATRLAHAPRLVVARRNGAHARLALSRPCSHAQP